MSRMLTVIDAGLSSALALARVGRRSAAEGALSALLALPDVPPAMAARVHRELAALALRAEKYRRARRHLRAALAVTPDDAQLHHDLGFAFENDPFGCDRRAVRHYRKATQLNANSPLHRASLGRAMVRINEIKSGMKVMRAAAEKAPTDVDVLAIVAEGLREAGRSDVTVQLLNKARFLAPGSHELKALWNRAQYDLTAEVQAQRTAAIRPVAPRTPTTIPFLRLHGENVSQPEQRTRLDAAAVVSSHLGGPKRFRVVGG